MSETVLKVGAGEQYTTINAAILAADNMGGNADIQVDAGTYVNDGGYLWDGVNNVTIEGVGGTATIVDPDYYAGGKAAIVTGGSNIVLKNLDISGVQVPDANGAAVRYDQGSLTLDNVHLHDNQNGILSAGDSSGSITIENSVIDHNGVGGNGHTHDIYIGDVANFTLTNSTVSDAEVGHEVKSRAENNTITNNVIADGNETASYTIDLPNGGNATITGNTIEQGSSTQNSAINAYGEEGATNSGNMVVFSGNTVINDGPNGALWSGGGGQFSGSGNDYYDVDNLGQAGSVGYTDDTSEPTLNISGYDNTTPISTQTDTISLMLSEDAWEGDAKADILIDGIPVARDQTIAASHTAGQDQVLTFSVPSAASHVVSVEFTNDAYGGSASQDRNLYIDNIGVNGFATGQSAPEDGGGIESFIVNGSGESSTTTIASNNSSNGDIPSNGYGSPLTLGSNSSTPTGSEGTANPGSDDNTSTSTGSESGVTYDLSLSDDEPHTVVLDGSVQSVQGGGGLLTVVAAAGHISVAGGSGGISFSEQPGSGGNQITTKTGATDTLILSGEDYVYSNGDDNITTGPVDVQIEVSDAAAIQGGTGFDKVTLDAGSTATINGNGGGPFVNMQSGSTLSVTGTLGSLHLTNNGGTANVDFTLAPWATAGGQEVAFSISGGSSTDWVDDGQVSITTSGSQGSTIQLGGGSVQVISQEADTIYAGSGYDNLILTGRSTVYAGTGQLVINGRGISEGQESTVYGNGGMVYFGGDTGNIVYYGGDKASVAQMGLSHVTLIGGSGRLTVLGGLSETVDGGSGGLNYDAQGGSSTITTAAGSTNTLVLGTQNTVDSWGSDVITGGSGNDNITAHGNATISGGTGNRTITLMGVDTVADAGGDNVTVTNGANVSIAVGSGDFVTESGATVSVSLGGAYAGSATVADSSGGAQIFANMNEGLSIFTWAGDTTSVTFGAGEASVTTGGSDVIRGGSESDTVNVSSNDVQVIGGSGTILVVESQGAENLKFVGGSGQAIVDSAGASDVVFGPGTTIVNESSSGPGSVYEFSDQGGGTDLINGFRAGVDTLVLGGRAITSENVSQGIAKIEFSDSTTLTLSGIQDANALDTILSNTPGRNESPNQTQPTNPAPTDGTGLVLSMSEDSWQGDAQFVVTVDGRQVGGVYTATASNATGQSQAISVPVTLPAGWSNVGVTFLNDAYDGSPSSDRNLYLDEATFDGQVVSGKQALVTDGTATFAVNTTSPAPVSTDTVTLGVSEDAWLGDAEMEVSVDGRQMGIYTVTASHSIGDSQSVVISGVAQSLNPHKVEVSFLNDAYGGSANTDRNLFVDKININGYQISSSQAALMSNGTATFEGDAGSMATTNTGSAAALGSSGESAKSSSSDASSTASSGLVLNVSEDAWQGDAQFAISVDGRQVGGIHTAAASNADGESEAIFVPISNDDSSHAVGITFLNDAYGGSPGSDRNLYLDSATIDGQVISGKQAILSNDTLNVSANMDSVVPVTTSTLVMNVSEDAWNGNAQMVVDVDGQRMGIYTITAAHAAGQSEAITIGDIPESLSPHDISVSFINDAYGGSPDTDRNLYVNSMQFDSQVVAGSSTAFLNNGTYHVIASAPSNWSA